MRSIPHSPEINLHIHNSNRLQGKYQASRACKPPPQNVVKEASPTRWWRLWCPSSRGYFYPWIPSYVGPCPRARRVRCAAAVCCAVPLVLADMQARVLCKMSPIAGTNPMPRLQGAQIGPELQRHSPASPVLPLSCCSLLPPYPPVETFPDHRCSWPPGRCSFLVGPQLNLPGKASRGCPHPSAIPNLVTRVWGLALPEDH